MNPMDYLRASDGNGEAVRAVVVEERQIGDMLINVDSVLNWPHKGIATSGGVDVDTGIFDPATVAVFYYTLSGSMIHIDEFAPGYTDEGNQQYEIIVLKPTTPWANAIYDALMSFSALPPGGLTGQALVKLSDADEDVGWGEVASGGSGWEPNETPAGTIDGTNTTFTTASEYSAGSLEVYLNGQRLRAGASNDYVETLDGFTMNYAPMAGDVLLVDYLVADTANIEGTNSIVSMRTVAGDANGTNTVFTVTSGKYAGGSLEVAVNGLMQQRGVDFTETDPAGGTFTMTTAPLAGDVVTAAYTLAAVATGNADTLDGYHLLGILDAIFPIGSKYDSGSSPTLPPLIAAIGTWQRFKGRFVIGVDESDTSMDTFGEQGGAKTHTLTTAEMPSHSHTSIDRIVVWDAGKAGLSGQAAGTQWMQSSGWGGNVVNNTGGGGAHNNMPPFEATYMWKRVS